MAVFDFEFFSKWKERICKKKKKMTKNKNKVHNSFSEDIFTSPNQAKTKRLYQLWKGNNVINYFLTFCFCTSLFWFKG